MYDVVRDSYGSPSYGMAEDLTTAMLMAEKFQREDDEGCAFIVLEVEVEGEEA